MSLIKLLSTLSLLTLFSLALCETDKKLDEGNVEKIFCNECKVAKAKALLTEALQCLAKDSKAKEVVEISNKYRSKPECKDKVMEATKRVHESMEKDKEAELKKCFKDEKLILKCWE